MSERDISFRGKRVDNGEWVEGYYCRAFRWTGDKEPKPAIQDDYFMFRLVDPTTVGQYTGLTDRNGKRIFEGDIIKSRRSTVYVVEHSESACGFVARGIEFYFRPCLTPVTMKDFEVIGNIHDNPELLDGGREP